MCGRSDGEQPPSIAYLSMEVALEADIPTYSGGLGVLAGDTLLAAADLGLPMVAVTLAYRGGHFRQQIDASGAQTAFPDPWTPESRTDAVPHRVEVEIEGRAVQVRAWRYCITGVGGHRLPVYLLDTNLTENEPQDRALTDDLYGGDERYRLAQEAVLGMGAVRMLEALDIAGSIQTYHLNEGHSALAAIAMMEQLSQGGSTACEERVRGRFVFTTHTPVAVGHDQFPLDLVRSVLGSRYADQLDRPEFSPDGVLNMTRLGLYFSRFASGVSMRHGRTSRSMFPEHEIATVTNGVHAGRWVAPPVAALLDRHVPPWREENMALRDAVALPLVELNDAHREAKQTLLGVIAAQSGVCLEADVLTLGFARRATAYKRPALLLSDLDRLRRIALEVGPLQIVYAGKAHPRDEQGQALIREVYAAAQALRGAVPIVYLEDYDMDLAAALVAGVDLWLNTPEQPLEASGTSGMKAALNGVPSLSVLDGWWIEGHIEGVTGWAIRDGWEIAPDEAAEADALYSKLEHAVIPQFYGEPDGYARVMRSAIALNGSFFNAQRMLRQYAAQAYRTRDAR